MNVEEFYAYITKHLTPEEALKKLLQSSLISYEKLKFESPEKSVHPLIIISMAAMELGWQIAVEKKESEVRGLALGTEEYMKELFKPKT